MEKKVCLLCGGKKNLTIHHLTARTLRKVQNKNGVEKMVLCRECHDLVEFEKQGMKWNKKLETARQQSRRKTLKEVDKWMEELMFLLQNDEGFQKKIKEEGWENLEDLQKKINLRLRGK